MKAKKKVTLGEDSYGNENEQASSIEVWKFGTIMT